MEYIGETKRLLRVRLEEQKRNVKLEYTDESRITDHAWAEDHMMSWVRQKFYIPSYMPLYPKHINQPSLDVKPLWRTLIREEVK